MEPDYLTNFRGLVSVGFGPHTPMVGGFPLHYCCRGFQGGKKNASNPPLMGVWGKENAL